MNSALLCFWYLFCCGVIVEAQFVGLQENYEKFQVDVTKAFSLFKQTSALFNSEENTLLPIQIPESPPVSNRAKRVLFERQQNTSSRAPECSYVGNLDYQIQNIDTCEGTSCVVTEVNCDGTIITTSTLWNYTRQITTNPNCFATKIYCYGNLSIEVNLKEQFNASYCKIDKVLCDLKERNLSQISNGALFTRCLVSVNCIDTYTRYGYDFYGFKCVQQELICNGTVIPLSSVNTSDINFLNSLSNCSVASRECNSVEISDTAVCYSVQKVCDGDKLSDGCYLHNEVIACDNSATTSCNIYQLQCSNGTGTVVIVNSTAQSLTSFSNCNAYSLLCNGKTVVMLSDRSDNLTCSTQNITCNGQSISNVKNYQGNWTQCAVSHIECQSPSSDCYKWQFTCNGTARCSVDVEQALCVSAESCIQPVNVSSCICPVDYVDTDCGSPRPINCSLQLQKPRLVCNPQYYRDQQSGDPDADLLDGDYPCLVYLLEETARLEYNLQCRFADSIAISDKVEQANFTYYIQTQNLNITRQTEWWLRFKIFNFNVLSDAGASTVLVLDKNQMMGNGVIKYNISLSQVPDRFWAGNRLYFEAGWYQQPHQPPGSVSIALDRRFVDSPDYKGKGTDVARSNVTTIVVLVVLAVVVVAAFIVYQVLKRKKIIG